MPRNIIARGFRLHVLYVNPKISSLCDRIHGQPGRVRQIKTESARSFLFGESRFSMLPIGKLKGGRSLLKIPAQQFAKQAARRDEAVPVVREVESVRPRLLLRRKSRLRLAKKVFLAVQRRLPHVDVVPDSSVFRGGNLPHRSPLPARRRPARRSS